MSRQSKAAKKKVEAKQWTKIRKDGGSGPARTTPKHGKVNTEKKRKAEELRKANEATARDAERAAQKAAEKAKDAKKKAPAKKQQQQKKAA